MKKAILFTVMLAVGILSFHPVSWADEIGDLKMELKRLREEHGAKIQELQNQIELMAKTEDEKLARIEETLDQKVVEYVGRYEGPFERGGLVARDVAGVSTVSLGGYMDHEYEDFGDTNSTFDQHRWIINVGAEIGERLRFYSEYEIEHGGPDAPNSGDGEAKVEQAWVDYLINDQVNMRAGAVLAPFGRTNIYHDSDLRDFTERPLVARDIIPTTWTESGVGAYGEFYPTEDFTLSYEAYVVNGLDAGFSDTGLGGGKGSLSSDNNNSKAWVGRVVASPALGHEVGFSGYWGRYDTAGNAITGVGVDWLSTWGPLEFEGEWAHFDVDDDGTNVAELFQGYRIQANYHFWPEFLNSTFLARDFENPTLTAMLRYGWAEIDDDADAGTGDNEEDRWTIGLNYRPVEQWVVKAEYIFSDTENEKLEKGNNDGFITSVAMAF